MWVVGKRSLRLADPVPKRPRHPEVNQQSPPRLEPNNQILAAPIDGSDPLTLELSRDLIGIERTRQPRVRDLDPLERSPLEDGREPPPDALDLGQLGHGNTLASRPAGRDRPGSCRVAR